MGKPSKSEAGPPVQRKRAAQTLELKVKKGEDHLVTLARVIQAPGFRHAQIIEAFGGRCFGSGVEKPTMMDHSEVIAETMATASTGDKDAASKLLSAQALTLDSLFTEMLRVASLNLRDYPDAADRYMRLGLKAQAASRSTLEALAKLHQPREQIVKHINVNEGGQAVIADQLHQHRDRGQNGKSDESAHAPCERAALPSPDPLGGTVQIPGGARQEAVQDARRGKRQRRATP